jgi:hypothetical protein
MMDWSSYTKTKSTQHQTSTVFHNVWFSCTAAAPWFNEKADSCSCCGNSSWTNRDGNAVNRMQGRECAVSKIGIGNSTM